MKIRNVLILTAIVLFLAPIQSSNASPITHKFELWGESTHVGKLGIVIGWGNGFFLGRGEKVVELAKCVDGMSYEQIIAIIDKRYNDHPEFWSRPLGLEILDALTVKGGPCEGMSPFPKTND